MFRIVDVSSVDSPELVTTVAEQEDAIRAAADLHAAKGHPIQVVGPNDEVVAQFPQPTSAEDSADAQLCFSQALKLVLQTHQQRPETS